LTTFLILTGLSLFILRSQLLRVGLQQAGNDPAKLHASKGLGAASGWLSLMGAALLMLLAIVANGYAWGFGLIVFGVLGGVALSGVVLPTIGSTTALGHHGGEGNASIAEVNRRYGAVVALAVPAVAAAAWFNHI
jgi:hypothetical protein